MSEYEKLDSKWIDKHKVARINNLRKMTMSDVVLVDELQDLLVPKQELPVIPKYVADYLEKAKKEIDLLRVFEIANGLDELEIWRKEYNWIRLYHLDFARAWLDGYEVEEEPKYNVQLKVRSSFGTVGVFLYKQGDEVLAGDNFKAYYPEEDKFRLTEQEIKDFDPRCWEFRKPV